MDRIKIVAVFITLIIIVLSGSASATHYILEPVFPGGTNHVIDVSSAIGSMVLVFAFFFLRRCDPYPVSS
jgi:hypothetical protein